MLENKNQEKNLDLRRTIVNELHAPVRRNFQRREVIVKVHINWSQKIVNNPLYSLKGFDETWSIDLIEFIPYADENNDYKYCLCVIDNFSKFAFMRPMLNKKTESVCDVLENIFITSKRVPQKIHHDEGGVK